MLMAFLAAGAFTFVLMPYIGRALKALGVLKKNYLGEMIPTGMGIAFLPAVLAGSIGGFRSGDVNTLFMLSMYLVITVMSFTGFIDDLTDDGTIKGIKGHMRCLFHGKLTGGGLKALAGIIVSIFVSMIISERFLEGLLNCFILVFFTNLLNLLDLRPGRAIKMFFLAWGLSVPMRSFNGYRSLLFPLAGSLTGYFPTEMGRKGMMGDSGANGLGAALGLYYCIGTNLHQKVITAIFLVSLNALSEVYSFSDFVSRNKLLRYLDELGNKGSGHT